MGQIPDLRLEPLTSAFENAEAIAVPVFDQDTFADAAWLPDVDREGVLDAIRRREFLAKPSQILVAQGRQLKAHLVFVGLGAREAAGAERWRRAAATVALAVRTRGHARLAFVVRMPSDAAVRAAVEGAVTATFDVDGYKTSQRDSVALAEITIAVPGEASAFHEAVAHGAALGNATNTARALANEPGNVLPPRELAARASTIATAAGLSVDVLQGSALSSLGMELLLGVGRGSAEAPCLVDIRYDPAGVVDGPVIGLVGKGVTFDTGGISIKPADSMDRMKYDMAGAAAVVGAMQAIAALRPPVRVRGIIPAAENMPGGRAIRPGDVLRSASGKTVEINNTDAEGRLILADALWYARARAGATHLVDVATLTGACVIALGRAASGLFGSHAAWNEFVRGIADDAGDRVWPMPLHEEYAEQLKSDIADLVNTGGRPGGAITAAAFLQAFAGDGPWVHLDVAGTAWLDEPKPWMPKGPTGVMARTLAGLALAHERIPR